ncbi:hypothetical protein Glove_128g9 [Diversispora epigaea]|uniref:Reverse transcriptase domain-containing protein n=1 Tax=Diversispora epigaea TaxID=1348612 RepID=A0A397IYA8_9GLOM|nr:hypothetical protein Glove_128g9 [Diversispora epigaea]
MDKRNADWNKIIEWIPYDRFQDIKEIAKSGYGTIYYTKWIDGFIQEEFEKAMDLYTDQQSQNYNNNKDVEITIDAMGLHQLGLNNTKPDLLQEFSQHDNRNDQIIGIKSQKHSLKTPANSSNLKQKRNNYNTSDHLQNGPKHMINNVFETGHKRIVLDRIIETRTDGNKYIITDPELVKQQLGLNNTKPDLLQEFSQHDNRNDQIIGIKSQKHSLKTPANSSNLKQKRNNYNTSDHLQNGPKHMINNVFETGHKRIVLDRIIETRTDGNKYIITDPELVKQQQYMPQELIDDTIYAETIMPITKEELSEHIMACNWEGQLEITRLIMLIETIRKLFTKIINQRLVNTLMKNKGKRKRNVDLFQDIKKAFDTVDLEILVKAMKRIKLPSRLINIIQNILKDRTNQGLTEFEKTDHYKVHKDIDQGDSISPLLYCRIHATRLQNDNNIADKLAKWGTLHREELKLNHEITDKQIYHK